MMTMKRRNQESNLSNGKKRTFHFYLPICLVDNLLSESEKKDVPVSKILQQKLQVLNKIKMEVLKDG